MQPEALDFVSHSLSKKSVKEVLLIGPQGKSFGCLTCKRSVFPNAQNWGKRMKYKKNMKSLIF